MKWVISILPLIACSLLFASDAGSNTSLILETGKSPTDSSQTGLTLASFVSSSRGLNQTNYSVKQLDLILHEGKSTEFLLGHSKLDRKINAYYIPGTSDQRALVIAGVHGSELSSVEVAYRLLSQLINGQQPFYSVIIVPSLFPDNAIMAMTEPGHIGTVANIGRYSHANAVDPNRQMPSPGKAFDEYAGLDHVGRVIEQENQLLLQLVQAFKPQRIANIHAIREANYGGIYADPRTDHNGIALGFASDSSLAVDMARAIYKQGGNVGGNKLDKKATALYYKDPIPVAAGSFQKRNMTGSVLTAHRGSGVSLGTWGSTAIANETYVNRNRDAMRILTIEYPGYKRPDDYRNGAQQLHHQKQVELYAHAIASIFLGRYYPEKEINDLANK